MNATTTVTAAVKLAKKNSLYCKEKTTAASTLFRPQHLSPFALLQQWMTTSELLLARKVAENAGVQNPIDEFEALWPLINS